MKNAILYVRVSSKEQVDGTSLETQERICTDYAHRNDMEVEKVFVEKGESAKTTDRTELKSLIEYITKNQRNLYGVIVYKIDRLARVSYDYASLKICFNKYGLKLLSATETLEETPVGRWVETMLAGTAQLDNEIRTERSVNGMTASVKAGRYVWRAPRGYINTGGRGTSNLAPDKPKVVRLIRKIWDYLDSGYSPEESRKEIAKDGLLGKNNKPISKSQFHRMIRNKIYMGVIEKFGLTVIGNFKCIIKPELFQRVLDKLNNKSKNVPIYKKDNEDFPLRGLVTCSNCNKRMTAGWSRGNGGKFGYYRCMYCKRVNYKKDIIESQFINFLKEHSYKLELKEMLIKAIEINLERRNERNKKKLSEVEKSLLILKAKEKQIVEKNFRNVISDTLAKELLDENEKRISEASLKLHTYEDNQDDVMKVVKHSISILEDISKVWFRVDLDIKKRFQKFLFPEGLSFNGTNFGTNKLALCIELKWTMAPQKLHLVTPGGFEPPILWLKTRCPGPLDDGAST